MAAPAFREAMPELVAATAPRFDERGRDLLEPDFPAPAAGIHEDRVAACREVTEATNRHALAPSAGLFKTGRRPYISVDIVGGN